MIEGERAGTSAMRRSRFPGIYHDVHGRMKDMITGGHTVSQRVAEEILNGTAHIRSPMCH